MEFEPALIQELESITSLQFSWIGSDVSWNSTSRSWGTDSTKRVHPSTSPPVKGSPIYVIFSSSEGLRTKTLSGYQDGQNIKVELSIIAPRYAEMKRITKDVIERLISMEQRKIGEGGPYIQELTYEQPVELYEPEPKLYRCVIDFEVYF